MALRDVSAMAVGRDKYEQSRARPHTALRTWRHTQKERLPALPQAAQV